MTVLHFAELFTTDRQFVCLLAFWIVQVFFEYECSLKVPCVGLREAAGQLPHSFTHLLPLPRALRHDSIRNRGVVSGDDGINADTSRSDIDRDTRN